MARKLILGYILFHVFVFYFFLKVCTIRKGTLKRVNNIVVETEQ